MRRRPPLAAILGAILLASCASRPGVDVSIGDTSAATVLVSDTQRTACSASIGDAFPRTIPLTTVRTAAPVTLRLRSADYVSEIRGWVHDDVDGRPSGAPIEEFVIGAAPARSRPTSCGRAGHTASS